MKKNYILCFLFLLALGTVEAANIFSNPGFESGEDWWGFQVQDGEATIDYMSAEAYEGSQAAHIQVTTPAQNNYQIQLNTPTNWVAEVGVKYKLGFYAKADQSLSIHIAAQDGPPGFGYRSGSNYSLNGEWKYVEMIYTSDVAGEGALRFNVFVGETAGNYYFDDFTLEVVNEVELTTPVPPTEGAYYTDVYRNMFLEMGKSETAINSKVMDAFNQLFYGDLATEALYFEVAPDMAYIKDIANNDIRSEGMSYGMMIALQLDKKAEFDRLWKFSKTYMQHSSGPRRGYFAWQVNATDYAVIDPNSAPDGEEYMAMALFFAAHRWGNGEGIFDYEAEAQELLYDMLNLESRNGGQVDGLTNMFDKTRKQVVFVPEGDLADFTDPSYHLPAFYELWSFWADADKEFWADAADTSRIYLRRAMHPVTGLTTDYMTFDGAPQTVSFNSNAGNFAYDSWRVVGNIAMDAHWFGNSWHSGQTDKLLGFLTTQGSSYPAIYHQDGTPTEGTHTSTGFYAMNGAGTLASNDMHAWDFLDRLYNQAMPTGQYRYYDGLLQMLSLLHASGNFKIYKPDVVSGNGGLITHSNLRVYPNPVNDDKIRVESELITEGKITLRNAVGNQVYTGTFSEGYAEIVTQGVVPGVYILTVSDFQHSKTEKVIIK